MPSDRCVMKPVKALIPAAGRGTRLQDATGGGPKELLRIGGRTMIEHCLRMVTASGVVETGLVIRPGKEEVTRVVQRCWSEQGLPLENLTIIEQDPPLGVADAMRLAVDFSEGGPLAVIMPDNLVLGGRPALAQILDGFEQCRENTVGVIPLTPERADSFGNVGRMELAPAPSGRPALVRTMSPKAPGVLSIPGPGRYFKGMIGTIYVPGWAERIKGLVLNHQGEMDDTDIILSLVEESRLYGVVLNGRGFDVGHARGLDEARAALGGEGGHAI